MKFAAVHNAYFFNEAGETGTIAYAGAENWGVHFMIKGRGKHANQDFATFAMTSKDAAELQTVTERLISFVPPLEDVMQAKGEGSRPGAPWVKQVSKAGDAAWDLIGQPLGSDETTKLGSLKWMQILSQDVLVSRIEEVDTIIYTPDTFRQFVEIANNRPEIQSSGSIWDRLK